MLMPLCRTIVYPPVVIYLLIVSQCRLSDISTQLQRALGEKKRVSHRRLGRLQHVEVGRPLHDSRLLFARLIAN
jgi:hypothetical protein